MFLEERGYSKTALTGKNILLTGGGGGIGAEAARAFSYMGANVIIADIDREKGMRAQKRINEEFGNENVDFFQADLSDEKQIDKLFEYILEHYSRLDVIVNNAAFVPMGGVDKVPISDWDRSYAVNLRAPVLLTQKFLPMMKTSGGVIVFIPSADTVPYMSAYEVFKSAQAQLCNTLSDEILSDKTLSDKTPGNIITYLLGPGLIKTETAVKSIEIVAASMGITTDEFYKLHEEYIFDVELAGAGYAVSVANANKYNGQTTSSQMVLADAGLLGDPDQTNSSAAMIDCDRLSTLFSGILSVFLDQYRGWQNKNLFQKKFILGDFKKQMGVSADVFKERLETLQGQVQNNQWDGFIQNKKMFAALGRFYEHQKELIQGYEKNADRLKSDTALLDGWIETLKNIVDCL